MKQYEYKHIDIQVGTGDFIMNDQGSQGWRVIHVYPVSTIANKVLFGRRRRFNKN